MSRKKELKEGDVMFEIDGFAVKKGHVYLVKNKPDGDAPSGYIKEGSTKLPSVGVPDAFQFPYDREAKIWNTGFYPTSKCYRGMEKGVIDLAVKQAVENVLEPYKEHVSDDTVFNQKDDTSFQDERHLFSIHAEKSFSTENPLQVLELYVALLGRQLTPIDKVGQPLYMESNFVILDATSKSEQTLTAASLFFEAVDTFGKMYIKDKELTCAVLNYIGYNALLTTPKEVLQSMLMHKLQDNTAELKTFIRTMEEATTEKGGYKFRIYNLFKFKGNRMKELAMRGNKVYWNDEEIGPGYKEAAESLVSNPAFAEVREQVMEYNK